MRIAAIQISHRLLDFSSSCRFCIIENRAYALILLHHVIYAVGNIKSSEESDNAFPEISKKIFEYLHLCAWISFSPLSLHGVGHNSGHPKGISEHWVAFQIQNGYPKLVCLGRSFMPWRVGNIQPWTCPDNHIPPVAIRQICHVAHRT
jgi:hypothetical protein